MIQGSIGGASTQTGLQFEREIDFQTFLASQPGFKLERVPGQAGVTVFRDAAAVGRCFRKFEFYAFLQEKEVDWKRYVSKKLLPDDSLLVIVRETLFIIEIKHQQVEGSVDEKLQTCDFKKKQYQKLVAPINLKVEYVYVLGRWFEHEKYRDVRDYIISVGCYYYFGHPPLSWLGLVPSQPSDRVI